jgi:3-phenylpropionate/cinnamic acid dioxygenase small subunit
VSHRDDITRLLHLYAERVDAGDFAGVGELFAGATYRTAGIDGELTGDEVGTVMARTVKLHDGVPGTKHVVTNVIVDLDEGETTASARSYFTVVQDLPDRGPSIIVAGRYHDRFTGADGTWRFTDRLIHIDQTGDLSAHLTMRL